MPLLFIHFSILHALIYINLYNRIVSLLSLENLEKRKYECLFAIFIISLILRITNDVHIPFHYDPGKNLVFAQAAVDSFPFFPQYNSYFNLGEYYEYQVLFPYLVALIHIATGISVVTSAKWLIILIGALLPVSIYYLCIEIKSDILVALIASFLIAISRLQLIAYMNYYPQILATTVMPIAFIFLIRAMKTKRIYALVPVCIISTVIFLASYLTFFVYCTILFTSLVVYYMCKKEHFSLQALVTIPLGAGALLSFYSFPILSRHGISNTMNTFILTIFRDYHVTFTNRPWSIGRYLEHSITTYFILVVAIGALLLLYKERQTVSGKSVSSYLNYPSIMLISWAGISAILLMSSKIRPILWVDRYLQFLDIAIIILGSFLVSFVLRHFDTVRIKGLSIWHPLIIVLLVLFISTLSTEHSFAYWGTEEDFKMLEYMQQNTPESSLIVAGGGVPSFWVSAISKRPVLGGASSQMIGERNDFNWASDTILNSPDIDHKMELIRQYGVNYIYLQVYPQKIKMWIQPLNMKGLIPFNNEMYFTIDKRMRLPDGGEVVLLKVNEATPRKTNVPYINWPLTYLSYAISILILVCMVIYYKKESTKDIIEV